MKQTDPRVKLYSEETTHANVWFSWDEKNSGAELTPDPHAVTEIRPEQKTEEKPKEAAQKREEAPKPEKEKKPKEARPPKPEKEKKPKEAKTPKPEKEKKPKEARPPKPEKEKKPKEAKAVKQNLRKNSTVAAAAAVAVLTLAVGLAIWQLPYKKVNVSYASFGVNVSISRISKAKTAGEFFDELKADGAAENTGITLSSEDIMMNDEEARITRGMTIDIRHTESGTARVAGIRQEITVFPGTVKEVVDANGIEYDEDDEMSPGAESSVDRGTEIRVDEVHYKTKEKTEKVKAEDKTVLDPSLIAGIKKYDEGHDGEGVFIYKTKYVNGEKAGTDKAVKEWIRQPSDNTLRLGTSATGNSGEYTIEEEKSAVSTSAYTAEAGTRGTLGEVLHTGSCAVDSDLIAPGTELWIEGYGYAYANDIIEGDGEGDVKLFMSSKALCDKWGSRNCDIYVLNPTD